MTDDLEETPRECRRCIGLGILIYRQKNQPDIVQECPACNGYGLIFKHSVLRMPIPHPEETEIVDGDPVTP